MSRWISGLVIVALSMCAATVYADPLPVTHQQAEQIYYNSHGQDYVTDRVGIGNPAGGTLYGDPDAGYFYLHQTTGTGTRITRADRLPEFWFPFRDVDWDGDGSGDGLSAYDENGVVLTADFSRASTGTYLGADGVIPTAGIDEPRYGFYNMTSPAYGGVLLEASATNYVEYSEAFDDWSNSSVTVTANSVAAPVYGNITCADTLRATGASGFVSYSTSATASGYYCFSVYLRAASSTSEGYISVGKASDGFTNYSTQLTTQWQRFDVSANLTTAGESVDAVFHPGQTAVDVYAFGAQVEAWSFATSYIPTSGTTVTRGRDDLWFPKPAGFDGGGTIILDWTTLWSDADYMSGNRHIVHWSTPAGFPANYQSVLYQNGLSSSSTIVGCNDGVAHTATINQTAYTPDKYAVQWSAVDGTVKVYRNDVSVVSDTYGGSFNQSASYSYIGLGYAGYGFVKNLIIFDRPDVEVDRW